jgi:putative peptidoglycan lipid II flippase
VRLLYERGAFAPSDTEATSSALFLYAFGLVGYTGVKVIAPAFYALARPRVPLVASVLAVATNLAVVGLLYPRMGFRALALGTALGALLNAALLGTLFERRVGGTFGWGLLRAVLPMAAAAGVMGGFVAVLIGALESRVGTTGLPAHLITGLGPVALGMALYGLLTHWWGVPEARTLWALVRERFRQTDS